MSESYFALDSKSALSPAAHASSKTLSKIKNKPSKELQTDLVSTGSVGSGSSTDVGSRSRPSSAKNEEEAENKRNGDEDAEEAPNVKKRFNSFTSSLLKLQRRFKESKERAKRQHRGMAARLSNAKRDIDEVRQRRSARVWRPGLAQAVPVLVAAKQQLQLQQAVVFQACGEKSVAGMYYVNCICVSGTCAYIRYVYLTCEKWSTSRST